MNTLRIVRYLCRIGCANLFAQLGIPAPHPRYPEEPQEGYEEKRQEKKQEIPTPESGWSHFYLGCCLTAALRTLNHEVHAPQFLPIEGGQGVVLNLSARFHPMGLIKCLRQPLGYRLHAYCYLQIVWDRAAGRRFNEHVECPVAHIWMSPERNYARPNFLVLNNRERRPIVRARWHGQTQRKRHQKPDRNFPRPS